MSLEIRLAGLKRAGLELRPRAQNRLECLVDLWSTYGPVLNLTAATSRDALMRHVCEGLLAVEAAHVARLAPGGGWLDLGSGGGFPGLVVAAVRPGPVVLVESRGKRAGFLRLASAKIEHEGEILETRIDVDTWSENVIESLEERVGIRFGVVGARAVWPVEVVGELTRKIGCRWWIAHVRPNCRTPEGLVEGARRDSEGYSVRAWGPGRGPK